MNAVRIRKFLATPSTEFPELKPMVGKNVEITVLDESQLEESVSVSQIPVSAIEEFDAREGSPPVANFKEMLGGWPEEERDDGFEDAVRKWRREPWMREV